MSNSLDFITHRNDTELRAIAGPDGGSKHGHNYLPLYHRHLHERRHDITRVLEIGVRGGASLNLWEQYFPNAELHAVDIDPECKQYERERVKIYIGDQGSREFLNTIPGDFDLIIDDGSHIPEHQVNTFLWLFQDKLRDRGVYVVEDCEGPDRKPTVDFFSHLPTLVNYWPEEYKGNWPELTSLEGYQDDYFVRNIIGVSFYRFIIFVDKGRNPEDGEAASRI